MTSTTSLIKALDQAFNMPSLFDSTFPNKLLRDTGGWDNYFTTEGFPYDIKVKTDEDGNTVETQVIFAVAGVDKSDIKIKVEYDRLYVDIEQKQQIEDSNVQYIRKGLSHRSMKKSFYLRGVDKSKVTSSLENGLLTIKLPTEEKEKGKFIDIKIK